MRIAPPVVAKPACSFCGRTQDSGAVIVTSEVAAICDGCIERAAMIVSKALGQSEAGRASAAKVLFRPSQHKRFRRLLVGS
jgi:ATP-dependent Clp protease ATP-binding subunit ClpX